MQTTVMELPKHGHWNDSSYQL